MMTPGKKVLFAFKSIAYAVIFLMFLFHQQARAEFLSAYKGACWQIYNKSYGVFKKMYHEREAKENFRYGNRFLKRQQKKDLRKAVKYYKTAIKMKPDFEEAFNQLGTTYTRLNLHSEAEKAFGKALVLNPNNAKAINNLGVCYLILKRTDEAISQFEKYQTMEPEDVKVYQNLGHAYIEKGEYKKSLQYFKESLKYDTEIKEVYYRIGMCYFILGDKENALKQAMILKSKFPRSAIGHKLEKKVKGNN